MRRCVLLQVEVPVSITAHAVREWTRIALRDSGVDRKVLDVQVEADVKTINMNKAVRSFHLRLQRDLYRATAYHSAAYFGLHT